MDAAGHRMFVGQPPDKMMGLCYITKQEPN